MTAPSKPRLPSAVVASGMSTLDVAAEILDFNRNRAPDMTVRKYAAMRASAFTFLRGTCHLYYRGWPTGAMFDHAPSAWISGDLHVENFGSYKGDNRLTYFDLNDFDEAVLAPGSWETARFLTSILVGAHTWGLNESEAVALMRYAFQSYLDQLIIGKPRWLERETASGVIGRLLTQVTGRTRVELLNRNTLVRKRSRRFIADGRRTATASAKERALSTRVMDEIVATSPEPGFFRVIDIARRIAGTGSLGVARYAVLIEGRGSPDRNVLLDVKEALPSSVAPWSPEIQPMWQSDAERVGSVQHRMQAVSPALLRAISVDGKSFIVRELQPFDDRMRLDDWCRKPRKLGAALDTLAQLAAWAPLRATGWHGSATMDAWSDFAARDDWYQSLIDGARDAAALNAERYAEFSAAYDSGAFNTPG